MSEDSDVIFTLPEIQKPFCDTCEDEGMVMAMVPGPTGQPVEALIYCPDCDPDQGGERVPE